MADIDNLKDAEASRPRSFGSLVMVWRFSVRYPLVIAAAMFSLVIAAAATLAIPNGFRLVVDRGFGQAGGDISRWFEYLLGVVGVQPNRAAQLLHRRGGFLQGTGLLLGAA